MSIDDLLYQPLTSVADDGFSERVMGRVHAMERHRLFVIAASVAACVVLAFVLLPMQAIGAQLNLAIVQIASSTAVSIAAGVVILTLVLERQFARF
jgi:phage gp29-like protein